MQRCDLRKRNGRGRKERRKEGREIIANIISMWKYKYFIMLKSVSSRKAGV